jgi:hypothetical protein
LLFCFRDALLEVVEQFTEGEDELVQDVAGLLEIEVVGFFQHAGVHFDHFLFDQSHGADSHEV